MDRERFDELTRAFGIQTTRRGALSLLAGLAGLHLTEADAKRRRGGKTGSKQRRQANGRVGKEEAENSCARLCEQVFPRLGRARDRCLQRAAENQAICECPSFCRRLFPRNVPRQLACLRAALEEWPDSLCRQCGADPDLACEQADGSHICCSGPSDICGEGSCCTPMTCWDGCTCGMLDPGCGLPPIDCGQFCGPGMYCEVKAGLYLDCCSCDGVGCGSGPGGTCPDGDVLNPGSGGPSTCPDGGVGGGGNNGGTP